jgi:hypothetical protein
MTMAKTASADAPVGGVALLLERPVGLLAWAAGSTTAPWQNGYVNVPLLGALVGAADGSR